MEMRKLGMPYTLSALPISAKGSNEVKLRYAPPAGMRHGSAHSAAAVTRGVDTWLILSQAEPTVGMADLG
jgi:hypothetical protein